jgi:hypothetical protein
LSIAHQQGWRRFVASHQQHHAIDWVAANGLFNIHASQVTEKHRGWTQLRFTQRHYGKFKWKAPSLPYTPLDAFGELTKMCIAGIQFGESVADTDDWPPVKQVMRPSLVLHPTAVAKTVAIVLSPPTPTPQR